MREPRTTLAKKAAEAQVGTDLRSYIKSAIERKLTQHKMAEELGVSPQTVNKWVSDYGFEAVVIYVERDKP